MGREGFEPTEAVKATDLQSAYFDHLHIYPNCSGSGTRTHVMRLMRPLWNHLQASRDIKRNIYSHEPIFRDEIFFCLIRITLRAVLESNQSRGFCRSSPLPLGQLPHKRILSSQTESLIKWKLNLKFMLLKQAAYREGIEPSLSRFGV